MSDPTNIFLNQTFKLFKLNRLLSDDQVILSSAETSYLKRNLAKRLYANYNRKDDLISRFESEEEVRLEIRITNGVKNLNGFIVQYFVIRCLDIMPRQMFVFMRKDATENALSNSNPFSTVVLTSGHNSHINSYIKHLLENMTKVPIVIRDYITPPGYINKVVDLMFEHLLQIRTDQNERIVNSLIGDFDISYSLKGGVINENLRNIAVSIPNADVLLLFKDGQGIIESVHEFLKKTTSLNLGNLVIAKFTSHLLAISEGKFRLEGHGLDGLGDGKESLVWCLLGLLSEENEKESVAS